jgi:hypothetical protein
MRATLQGIRAAFCTPLVHTDSRTTHKNTPCGQKPGSLNFAAFGTNSYHWALKGYSEYEADIVRGKLLLTQLGKVRPITGHEGPEGLFFL